MLEEHKAGFHREGHNFSVLTYWYLTSLLIASFHISEAGRAAGHCGGQGAVRDGTSGEGGQTAV